MLASNPTPRISRRLYELLVKVSLACRGLSSRQRSAWLDLMVYLPPLEVAPLALKFVNINGFKFDPLAH